MNLWIPLVFLISAFIEPAIISGPEAPFRIGVAGLSHGHVHWILDRHSDEDIDIVGIAETDSALSKKLLNQYALDERLWYGNLGDMLDQTKPDAVCAFGSIYDHLEVVQACAPRGIPVMVEKPLAVNLSHAEEIRALADKYNVVVLTNYETTWYPTNHKAFEILGEGKIGPVRKIIVRDGHQGPEEIGVSREFLKWLTDPAQNGAGALMDFGCYVANLSTWIMGNQKPQSVTAVTQQIKPEIYSKVEDEATIILTYPQAQSIIQASWNWPFSRKDMEVYGKTGYVISHNRNEMSFRLEGEPTPGNILMSDSDLTYNDPFRYLAGVVRGEIDPSGALSSLENNLIVMEILDAALRSAREGKCIEIGD